MNFHKLQNLLVFVLLAFIIATFSVFAQTLSREQQLARGIFKELIEINTTDSKGNTTIAAEAMAKRLKDAGFPAADVLVLGPNSRKGNLVARLHGTGAHKPILLLAHLDVVEANREDWSVDPFKFLEQDGYFYGRGTTDDKAMAAIFVANLIRYKQEGFVPNRDLILALTADEELGDIPTNGVKWLLENHRNLIDSEFALNEGAGVGLKEGKPFVHGLQTSEKVIVFYRLEVKNPGGHSARPSKDNAIYHLAEGLNRLAKFDFPFKLNEATKLYFQKMSKIQTGQVAEDMLAITQDSPDPAAIERLSAIPIYNAAMRTTCVATRLDGGHADNALPQIAGALVNCRILPGEPVDEVKQTLIKVIANDKITVSQVGSFTSSPPSPLRPDIVQAIERLSSEFWPGVPVIPMMGAGATDGRFLRNSGIATYGHMGLAGDMFDVRAHGKDERLLVSSFFTGQEYLYRLVKALSSGKL